MKRFHVLDEDALPVEVSGGLENALAHYVLAGADPLVRQILDAAVGGPKQYAAFQDLLKGRNDNALNRVLKWMVAEHLIEKGRYALQAPTDVYWLTTFGALIRDWVEFYDRINRVVRGTGVEAAA